MATAGKYSCEVSADAPSFHTLIAAAELEVVGELTEIQKTPEKIINKKQTIKLCC